MKQIGKVKYIILFLIIVIAYLIIRIMYWNYSERRIENVMVGMLVLLLVVDGYLAIKKRLTNKIILLSIIIAGCVMRIGYMLYTNCEVRAHDMNKFSEDAYGQAGYLLTLLKSKHLPQSNMDQLYQQPFFYLTGAEISRIINEILHSKNEYDLVDAAKLVSCFSSCATLFIMEKLCDLVSMKEKSKIIAVSVIAFLPGFYLSGGRVNCDALAVFFMTLAVMYTLLWMKEQSWKNTICLAIIYGLGVMTKISCAVIAIFTAIVFIMEFIRRVRVHQWKTLLTRYLVFAGISLPLGLWYAIRNYIMFGQNLTYVLKPPADTGLYCGGYSYVSRFLSININNMLKTPYAQPFGDFNFPSYLIKTSLFGEFQYKVADVFPILLLFVGTVIAIVFMGAFVWQIKQIVKKQATKDIRSLVVIEALVIVFSVYFCMRYPYGCSMDFRYYGIVAIIGSVLFGNMLDKIQVHFLSVIAKYVVGLFGILSCCMYLLV